MTVELDRADLINMLHGITPSYEAMNFIPKDFGQYIGGFVDDWKWNRHVPDEYSDEFLFKLYKMCKA